MDQAVPSLGADSDTSLYLAYQPAPAGKPGAGASTRAPAKLAGGEAGPAWCPKDGRRIHYERRRPEDTVLYQVVQEHLETFLAQVELETGAGLPEFVKEEFEAFLQCGILAHGFLRLRCADCRYLIARGRTPCPYGG
jgi:hypothetical protein